MNPISRLLRRPDFRAHPVRAVWRRLFWRVRWFLSSRPWVLTLQSGQKLLSPRHGTGVQIYYRGCSEPETFELIRRLLERGMNVIDVGAHLGEYTLLCAGAVGSEGRVHAFEPDADLIDFLGRSVVLNRFSNVTLNQMAVADRPGDREFEIRSKLAFSSLRPERGDMSPHRHGLVRSVKVPTTTLDAYCSLHSGHIHLVKVDVEGAELQVFQGAERLMTRDPSRAPLWVFEVSEETCSRFGYRPEVLVEHLVERRYHVVRYWGGGRAERFDATSRVRGTFNLLACMDLERVMRRLAG